jgi:hypothetical protein
MHLIENLGRGARLIGDLKMSEHVDQVAENPTLPTEPIDPTMKLSMSKMGDVTYYTLEADAGEAKNHMRTFGTKGPDFFYGLLQQIVNAGSKGAYPDEQGIKFILGFITGNTAPNGRSTSWREHQQPWLRRSSATELPANTRS